MHIFVVINPQSSDRVRVIYLCLTYKPVDFINFMYKIKKLNTFFVITRLVFEIYVKDLKVNDVYNVCYRNILT